MPMECKEILAFLAANPYVKAIYGLLINLSIGLEKIILKDEFIYGLAMCMRI